MLHTWHNKGRPQTVRISHLPSAREAEVSVDCTTDAACALTGVRIDTPCEGKGLCGACKVKFIQGAPEPTAWDKAHMDAGELAQGYRLACRARLNEDAIVSTPRPGQTLLFAGHRHDYRLSPVAQRGVIEVTAADVPGTELETVIPATALKPGSATFTLHTLRDELRRVEMGRNTRDHLGIAAFVERDVLTGWLLDLRTGRELAQGTSGIIAHDASEVDRQDSVSAACRRLTRSLCTSAHVRSEDVSDVAVVGLARARPGGPRSTGCGTDPLVDTAAAAAMGCGTRVDDRVLLLGLDPFPWLLLTCRGEGWMASAPRAARAIQIFARPDTDGAVDRVSLDDDVVLGHSGSLPKSLGFSAAADCVTGLRQMGVLDERGRFTDSVTGTLEPKMAGRLTVRSGAGSFRLWGEPGGRQLELSASHVRAIQQIRAEVIALGARLSRAADIDLVDVERVLLVGSSAGSLRARAAVALGLIPRGVGTVQQAPDAIGLGARLGVLSSAAARDIERVSAATHHLPSDRAGTWADALYLHMAGTGSLDGPKGPVLELTGRGSVGIGRRA